MHERNRISLLFSLPKLWEKNRESMEKYAHAHSYFNIPIHPLLLTHVKHMFAVYVQNFTNKKNIDFPHAHQCKVEYGTQYKQPVRVFSFSPCFRLHNTQNLYTHTFIFTSAGYHLALSFIVMQRITNESVARFCDDKILIDGILITNNAFIYVNQCA